MQKHDLNTLPACAADLASDPGQFDAVATAKKIAAGEISPGECLEAAIGRAEVINLKINALTNTYFDLARATKPADSVFAGVPFLIKDLMDWEGTINTFGSRSYGDNLSKHQTPFIQSLLDTGLVPFARTATPEMGFSATTEPLANGPTLNPWNTNHSPGGSSGGSAAAVAAGIVPMAQSGDGGGSIRIPASCCGLFGLKLSRDRIASTGDEKIPIRVTVPNVISRSVRDSAALLAAIERKGKGQVHQLTGLVTGPSGKRLRIGYALKSASMFGRDVDPAIAKAHQETVALCADMGHEMIDFTLPFDMVEFGEIFMRYWSAGAAMFATQTARRLGYAPGPDILEPWTLGLAKYHSDFWSQGFLGAAGKLHFLGVIMRLRKFARAYHKMFEAIDLLLTPTVSTPPPEIGYLAPTVDFKVLYDRTVHFAAFTALENVSGAPAMSVPLAWSEDGLPIGMQFAGRVGAESILLGLAYELEQASAWCDKRPPVSAV